MNRDTRYKWYRFRDGCLDVLGSVIVGLLVAVIVVMAVAAIDCARRDAREVEMQNTEY